MSNRRGAVRSRSVSQMPGSWHYEQRIPVNMDSRTLAVIPAGFALVFGGIGLFIADDGAREQVSFLANPVVWIGFVHIVFCAALALWMYFVRWEWSSVQLGLLGQTALGSSYLLHFASLGSFVLYGSGPWDQRAALLALSIAWHTGWVVHVLHCCQRLWKDEDARARIWVTEDGVTIFRQDVATTAFRDAGLRLYPGARTLAVFATMLIAAIVWRGELASHFGVSLVHLVLIVFGPSMSMLGLTLSTFSLVALIWLPARMVAETGQPVLVDMLNSGRVK